MRKSCCAVDGTVYTIREIPSSLYLEYTNLDDRNAQMALLGKCVLGEDGEPLGDRLGEQIALREIPPLLEAVFTLSGFADDAEEKKSSTRSVSPSTSSPRSAESLPSTKSPIASALESLTNGSSSGVLKPESATD